MSIVAFICFGLAWLGFIYLVYRAWAIRRGIRQEDLNLPVVVAGSGDGPRYMRVMAPDFYDDEKEADISHLEKYYVMGNSMMLCGIKGEDIVLVDSSKKDYSMPSILLIRKEHADTDAANFKLRRTWLVCENAEYPLLEAKVREILASKKFRPIKDAPEYPSDEVILEDFKQVRFERFQAKFSLKQKVVISTTLHNGEKEKGSPVYGKIMFSIHPYSSIVGKVESVYRRELRPL